MAALEAVGNTRDPLGTRDSIRQGVDKDRFVDTIVSRLSRSRTKE